MAITPPQAETLYPRLAPPVKRENGFQKYCPSPLAMDNSP